MATIDDFLRDNPTLSDAEIAPNSLHLPKKDVALTGIILAADVDHITFAHLGHRFDVSRDDIIDISNTDTAVPNPFGKGQAVELTVNLGTKLRPHGAISASSLIEGKPFTISQPSEIADNSYPHHTAAELAWLAENGLDDDEIAAMSTNSGTYCGHNTTSPKWSGTNSNGRQDDGKSDESYADDASHDDAGADD